MVEDKTTEVEWRKQSNQAAPQRGAVELESLHYIGRADAAEVSRQRQGGVEQCKWRKVVKMEQQSQGDAPGENELNDRG